MTHARSGFSLMELVIAITILGIMAAVVGPYLMRWLFEARDSRARIELQTMKEALITYHMQKGSYPKVLTELTAGGRRAYLDPANVTVEGTSILDPWNNPYIYRPTPKGAPNPFELYSLGDPDGDGQRIDALKPKK
jgi:general secretion pathway protein G